MFKAIVRTFIILLIAFVIGWGSYLIIQNSPQTFSRGGFRNGERPNFGDGESFAPGGNLPQNFRGEEGEFQERGGFVSIIVGFGKILGHLLLFASVTLLIVVIGKLLPRKAVKAEVDALPQKH